MMTVVLLGKTRNSPQLYCLFLASSDITQEIVAPGFIPPFFVSLPYRNNEIYDREKEEGKICTTYS